MENPLLFFTDKETERLNAMAHEQLSYLIEGLQKKEVQPSQNQLNR